MAKRGNVLGHVDLCDETHYFHGKPMLSFSAKTATPVVVIAFPLLVFLELRESNDRFAAYVEREITRHALQTRLPVQSTTGMSLQHTPGREESTETVSSSQSELVQSENQASRNCGSGSLQMSGRPQQQPTRRRRRSITGLQVENGRVVLAQPGSGVGSKPPRELCTAVFRHPLAAEAPF